jgi:hypothetical protein
MTANNIIDNGADSGQESTGPTIPLLPEGIDAATPSNPALAASEAFLIGAKIVSYALIGSPPLETFFTADLVTVGRRLWRWHLVAYAIEQEGAITGESLRQVLTLLKIR